ncbi:MAG: ATP-binding protein [Myxococcota bacterium]
MIRIVLIGAESTGKSTLAAALVDALGLPCTGEFVRTYVDGLSRPLSADDLDPIARGQLDEEDRFATAGRVLHDTNLLSTLVYAHHYFGVRQAWVERAFSQRDYAVYLFCQPDIPWVADPGQREGPQVRDVLHRRFANALRERALRVVKIAGTPQARLRTALDAIAALT